MWSDFEEEDEKKPQSAQSEGVEDDQSITKFTKQSRKKSVMNYGFAAEDAEESQKIDTPTRSSEQQRSYMGTYENMQSG